MKHKLILLLSSLLLLTGCASKITNGEVVVVDKEYDEAYTYYYMGGSFLLPMTFDDHYYLTIQQGNTTNTIEVDKFDFDYIKIGDKLIYKDGNLYEQK